MKIRLERQDDYRAVEILTRDAFWNVYCPGCTEHFVLHCYRGNPDFIPELDFVMEENDRLIGHVMFSKAELVLPDGMRKPSWTFGPICIHPGYKRKGYGLKLLQFALERARELGVGFLCMEGNIDFYKNAGFSLASPFFLAQELIPGWLKANGIEEATYCPPKGYFVADENPEAFEQFEATFPAKEKKRLPGQLFYDGVMETDRIILRPWRDGDAPVLYKWASDPDVGPRAGWPPHQSVEKETGEAIGAMGYGPSCNCNLPARDGEPLIGYWIAKPYWNRGICTEALGLMIEHIRCMTDIKSLISGHFTDNPASGRVMEKCGFVPTGETVIDENQYQGSDRPIRVLRLEL